MLTSLEFFLEVFLKWFFVGAINAFLISPNHNSPNHKGSLEEEIALAGLTRELAGSVWGAELEAMPTMTEAVEIVVDCSWGSRETR